jgi:predicted amidohydrolase YtcJ
MSNERKAAIQTDRYPRGMPRRLITADAIRTADGLVGDALVVEHGRIAAIGRADDLRSNLPEDRFPGATIVPGLRDAHLHPLGHAATLVTPTLKQARDYDDLAEILGAAHRALPDGAALVALRLDDESLAEGRLPDRSFLDSVVPDRPMMALRYCGHVAVANTAALDHAGITPHGADPSGGSMDRDPAGVLTGVLRETAIEPVSEALLAHAPPVTDDDLVGATLGLASVGITGIGAMAWTDRGPWSGGDSEVATIIAAAHRLAVDMRVMVVARDETDLESAAAALDGASSRVRFAGVKMFADGSLGGHTAAMHDGFADDPDETGTDRLDPEWAHRLATASLRMGGLVAIHSIGDRANTNVLDLMERLIAEGADPSRLRVEHASVLTVDDIARFGRLGVTASVQPAFIASETGWLEKRLGPERLARTYPFRSLLDAGAPLAGGSDCPVEPPHPLWGMAAARDRCGIVAEEGLSAAEALALFTDDSARAIGDDASIAVGAPATITIVDVDPVVASPDELRSAAVLGTWLDGDPVAVPPATVAWRE